MPKTKKPGLLSRLFPTLFPPKDQVEYEEYPEWSSVSSADQQRIMQRLTRLSDAYQQKFRRAGAMDVPLHHRIRSQHIQTEKRRHTSGPDALQAAKQLTPAEIDVLMRALLAQLTQLEQIGFVHGAIRPDSLTIHKDHAIWSASVGRFHSGRFTDEPVDKENLAESPWMSPEYWRKLHYPHAPAALDASDVF
ncbi:MAG: hypothetical protein IKK21_02710, partial [Clostridia bacterium]|nr:hypothetical protein [Clostridia bacterium]